MSITIEVLKPNGKVKYSFSGNTKHHAEEVLFMAEKRYNVKGGWGDLSLLMNGWPCIPGDSVTSRHNCHQLLINQSKGRKIELNITKDSSGYAVSHGRPKGATGKITYTNGGVPLYS